MARCASTKRDEKRLMVHILCIMSFYKVQYMGELMFATTGAIPTFHKNFDGFMGFLRDRELGAVALSPKRFGAVLGIDLQTLANQAHVHRNTLSRAPASESVQRFLREVLRVIRAVADLSGDIEQALFWYRNEPLRPFEYKTAEQLVSDGRTDDLLRYIGSLQVGAAG